MMWAINMRLSNLRLMVVGCSAHHDLENTLNAACLSQVFFSFSCKTVDCDAFKVINDACLVFDGGLVVDTTFHTNDSSIYAAGPLTKYSRRYHADQWSDSCFNSKEVGQSLASVLLPLCDPTLERPAGPPSDQEHLIPLYSQAKIQGHYSPSEFLNHKPSTSVQVVKMFSMCCVTQFSPLI